MFSALVGCRTWGSKCKILLCLAHEDIVVKQKCPQLLILLGALNSWSVVALDLLKESQKAGAGNKRIFFTVMFRSGKNSYVYLSWNSIKLCGKDEVKSANNVYVDLVKIQVKSFFGNRFLLSLPEAFFLSLESLLDYANDISDSLLLIHFFIKKLSVFLESDIC